jgi:hypothetical protein
MSEPNPKISLCEKIKNFFVSSSCCNKTVIHNETIIIKKSNTEKEFSKINNDIKLNS